MTTPTWGQPQPPYPPAPKPPMSAGKKIAIGAAIVVGAPIFIAGMVDGALKSIHTQTTAATVQSSPTPVASANATPSTAAPSSAAPSPSTDPNAGTGMKVVAWWAAGGQDRANAIDNDFTAIGTDGTNQDVTSLGTDCGKLTADVESAQSYDPVPDAAAQSHWAQALADYHAGASDCTAGAAQQDASLISKASGELGDGNAQMGQLVTRIRQLGGNAG